VVGAALTSPELLETELTVVAGKVVYRRKRI